MSAMTMKKATSMNRLLAFVMMPAALWLTAAAHAAAPGITGPTFNLTAQPAYLNQPDGQAVYSWGYGCNGAPTGFAPPATLMPGANCTTMQVPGPTLIVTEGQTVTVNLTNGLPTAAGNTSMLFPGFTVTATGGVTGLLTNEAAPGGTVTYTFTASSPGTRAYYSGTQSDLQVEMGLYGAIIVLPATVPTVCNSTNTNLFGKTSYLTEVDFRLSHAAYDHPGSCYDREYLFQFAEMDTNIHRQALAQVTALANCTAGAAGCSLEVPTEPYHPAYFLINGRSMPDDMDANYGVEYPHQPYNGNPHMHPGEQVLIRVIGQGRWEHPFHEHGNHVRILARDANLILSPTNPAANLAGRLMFTTDTFPGQSFDGIFYWSGRGLNWDPYAHNPASSDPLAKLTCTPDANGYNTLNTAALNYYEWCQDHNKPLEVAPFGDVAAGGPATLPNPNIFTNGAWYGGTPYLGPDANVRSAGPTSNLQPANTQANPAGERGWAFMWHSHNEREITTNNVFPGGMLMMMLVDSREFVIDESK
jgi:FtsP/CotA-like multicopper oxidase with cupredoxin domain